MVFTRSQGRRPAFINTQIGHGGQNSQSSQKNKKRGNRTGFFNQQSDNTWSQNQNSNQNPNRKPHFDRKQKKTNHGNESQYQKTHDQTRVQKNQTPNHDKDNHHSQKPTLPHASNDTIKVVASTKGGPKENTDKVRRIEGPEWASTKASLDFVEESGLANNRDTTIIALNLIDYVLNPGTHANWNGELSKFRLAATCFFVAGLITGANNSAETVAQAIGQSAWKHVAFAYQSYRGWEDPQQVLNSLLVTGRDVERGYAILHEQRDKIRELVGDYADVVDMLPALLGRQDFFPSPTMPGGFASFGGFGGDVNGSLTMVVDGDEDEDLYS